MIGLFSPNLKGVWVPSTQHTVYLDLVHTVHTVPHNSHPHWVFVFLLAGEKGSVAGIWRPPCQRRGGEVPQVGQTVVISSNNIIMYKCSVIDSCWLSWCYLPVALFWSSSGCSYWESQHTTSSHAHPPTHHNDHIGSSQNWHHHTFTTVWIVSWSHARSNVEWAAKGKLQVVAIRVIMLCQWWGNVFAWIARVPTPCSV